MGDVNLGDLILDFATAASKRFETAKIDVDELVVAFYDWQPAEFVRRYPDWLSQVLAKFSSTPMGAPGDVVIAERALSLLRGLSYDNAWEVCDAIV